MEETKAHCCDYIKRNNNNDGTWTFTVGQSYGGADLQTQEFTLNELCLSMLRRILNDELKSDAEIYKL